MNTKHTYNARVPIGFPRVFVTVKNIKANTISEARSILKKRYGIPQGERLPLGTDVWEVA